MTRGKSICNVLKTIRKQIADANDISYNPTPCDYKGECLGTCPHCEAEVRYIENSLNALRMAGKVITIVGLSAGLSVFTSCNGNKSGNATQVENSRKSMGKAPVNVETTGIVDENWNNADTPKVKTTFKVETPVIKKDKRQRLMGTAPVIKGDVEVMPETTDTTSAMIFDEVEEMPSFPGGKTALIDYIYNNLKYPETADCVQGRVIIGFVVEKDGSLSGIKVVRSVDFCLDKEAVRVVKSMPNWIPGKRNGVTVRVKYYVPVSFRLQ